MAMDFNELNLSELDRDLTAEERDEWQSIYASYRSRSVLSGTVLGVDKYNFAHLSGNELPRRVRCLIIIKYRVKIIIPEHEVFLEDMKADYHVLHSMGGAKVHFIVTYIDRENGYAIASRKFALRKIRRIASGHIRKNQIADVSVISVGRNVCTVSYRGYDVRLSQRDVSYSIVPDLREVIHPGETKKALIKDFDADKEMLTLSIKEAAPHPFDGIETRHPVGSIRIAAIVGKYGGGVFCRLYDNVTDVLCSYESMNYDGDFKVGDSVEVRISKMNMDKKLVYGKILRKVK